MKRNYWTFSLDKYVSFQYGINLPLHQKDFRQKVLLFDASFFESGIKYGIYAFMPPCIFKNTESHVLLNRYLEAREHRFFTDRITPEDRYIRLADLEQWGEYYQNVIIPKQFGEFTNVPFIKGGKLTEENFNASNFISKSSVIEIDPYTDTSWEETKGLTDWEINANLTITSHSNIWWDEFDFTILEDEIYPEILENTVDNRVIAYRIVPRFNSFLRNVREKVVELGGEMSLEEYDSRYVTEEGILLDNSIIYQEDITSGKVKLPKEL